MPFKAKINEHAQIVFPSTQAASAFQVWKKDNPGAIILITHAKSTRSTSQNAYYWVYLEAISKETGDNATDLHEVFKRELLPPIFKKIRGKEYKLPASTTDLDKAAFGEYLDKICALTNIPLPDVEAAGYIANYDNPRR